MTTDKPREPYDLRDGTGRSDAFYRKLAHCADLISCLLEDRASAIVSDYAEFAASVVEDRASAVLSDYAEFAASVVEDRASAVLSECAEFAASVVGEPRRSRDEYGIELLTLGLLRWRYQRAAFATPRFARRLAEQLFRGRSKFPKFRHAIDAVRGVILGVFFVPRIHTATRATERSTATLHSLLLWLEATGEFKEECARLAVWQRYFESLPAACTGQILGIADELFETFRELTELHLGAHTVSVAEYQRWRGPSRRFSEDGLLVTKSREEYHLNMLASELMNRGLQASFELTTRRVVLVPGCMRAKPNHGCEAVVRGCDVICTGCEPSCAVYQLQRIGSIHNFRVRVVPHSTDFTRWLVRYQQEEGTGIVPVACPLHLAAGGYEVRRLGLKAQCVLLDYCGCKKHWHPEGIPTQANHRRVVELIQLGRSGPRLTASLESMACSSWGTEI